MACVLSTWSIVFLQSQCTRSWIQPCSQLREFSSNHDEQGLVSSHADESLCSLPRTKSACSMIYKEKKNRVVKKENPPNEKCQSQARKKKNRQEDRLTNTRNVLIIQSKLCWIELSALRTLHESSTLWIFFLGDSITKTNSVWNDKLCHMALICSSYHSTPFILTSKALSTKLCMKLLNRSWEWLSY